MRFQSELVFQVLHEIGSLLERHHEEICPEGYELSPNWKQYRAMEQAGCLCLVTARKDENTLVGYATAVVSPHLHSASNIVALGDMIYLLPEYRNGRNGLNLIRTAERHCREMKAKSLTWSAKPGTVLEELLPLLGYDREEVVWLKTI